MKKFLLVLLLLGSVLAAQAQLTTTTALTSVCQGTSFTAAVSFASTGTVYQSGNVFTVQLSDAAGSFASASAIGSISSTAVTGNITVAFPASQAPGSGYRVRVVASNPAVTGTDNGTDIAVLATPDVIASSNSPVCQGQPILLTAQTSAAGATFIWTGPNSFTSSVFNPTIFNATLSAAGTYHVWVTANGCSAEDTVHVTVNSEPGAPMLSSDPVCAGGTLSVGVTNPVPGGVYNWTGPSGPLTTTGPWVSIMNASTMHAGVYSAQVTVNGCTSPAGSVTAVVSTGLVAAPVATSNSPVCGGGLLELYASTVPGATYSWVGPGFTSLQQNPIRANAQPGHSGNYSVWAHLNGCVSPASVVQVTVSAFPPAPSLTSNSPICAGQTLQLSASGAPTLTYSWVGPGITAAMVNDQNPVQPNAQPSHSGNYSVWAILNGCVSPASVVQVTVHPNSAPIVHTNSPVCQGSTLVLSANLVPGTTYSWTGPNGTLHLGQILSITNAQLSDSGLYTLINTLAGCVSAPTIINGFVVPEPAVPAIFSNSPICAGQTLQLSTPPLAGATYNWTAPNGLTYQGQTITVPGATPTTTAFSGSWAMFITNAFGCTSDSGTANIVVSPGPVFSYSSGSYCQNSGATPLPTIASGMAGTFTSSPAGLILNNSTGQITVAGSALGSYTITHTVASCPTPASQTVAIVNSFSTSFSYSNTAFCQNFSPSVQVPVFPAGAVAGTFSAFPGGLALDPTTGAISLSVSAPGVYQVINTISAASGCQAAADTVSVTIHPPVPAPVITSNSPVCLGATLSMSAAGPAGSTYTWTGPGGTFTGASVVIPNITMQQAGTYQVQTSGNGCQGPVSTVQVVALPTTAVTISGNNTVMAGTTAYLQASPAGSYSWSGPNGFSAVGNPVYIQQVSVAKTGNYTATQVAGCGSPGTFTLQVGLANQITGIVFNDANNNGIMDAGETPRANQLVRLLPGNHYANTNTQGEYTFSTGAGSFTVQPVSLTPFQVLSPPQLALSFSGLNNQSGNNNFGVFTPENRDLRTLLIHSWWPPGPGFSRAYHVEVSNLGTLPSSGQVRTVFPAGVSLISSTPGVTVSADTLSWNLSNLAPGASYTFSVNYLVPATMPLATVLQYTASVATIGTDVNPTNNTASMVMTVVGSYDPNDKAVSPPGPISPAQVAAGQELVYKIRFQNTGTFLAFNVMVADTLSELLDLSTFEMHSASHNYNVSLRENGIVEWHFPDIMLPDSTSDEPNSHGYIQYSIKPKATLQLGDEIENTAHIFFDFNEAIVTNTTSTVVALPNASAALLPENLLQVFPNPNSGNATLRLANTAAGEVQVRVMNMLGQEVLHLRRTAAGGGFEMPLDLQKQPAGIYLVQVRQGEKIYSAKLVRER